jgi:RimJ/RimL family protein N-acetyltransferase
MQTQNLTLRPWRQSDLQFLAQLCADETVMRYFPKVLTEEESADFLRRLIAHQEEHGFSYFAVEEKQSGKLIGFIGLAAQKYESPFTPAVDVGWRLMPSAWGKGYATEGAKRCLQLAFEELKLDRVIAVCAATNKGSERVMQKIGMQKIGEFVHPNLEVDSALQPCLCYAIEAKDWMGE